jgi:hypothetical protein
VLRRGPSVMQTRVKTTEKNQQEDLKSEISRPKARNLSVTVRKRTSKVKKVARSLGVNSRKSKQMNLKNSRKLLMERVQQELHRIEGRNKRFLILSKSLGYVI